MTSIRTENVGGLLIVTMSRGKANALPGSAKGGPRLRRAQTILRMWAQQEGLAFARHL